MGKGNGSLNRAKQMVFRCQERFPCATRPTKAERNSICIMKVKKLKPAYPPTSSDRLTQRIAQNCPGKVCSSQFVHFIRGQTCQFCFSMCPIQTTGQCSGFNCQNTSSVVVKSSGRHTAPHCPRCIGHNLVRPLAPPFSCSGFCERPFQTSAYCCKYS